MTTLFVSQLLSPEGWLSSVRLRVEQGRIASMEPGAAPLPGDERHAVLVPAMPNLHSHAFQRGMAGLAELRGSATDDFWSWRETMYRFASRMSPEQLEAVAGQAYMEMVESGFCRVGEFQYLHHDLEGRPYADVGEMCGRLVAAARCTGIAMTLLPVFYAHASFGGVRPRDHQQRFVSGIDDYAKLIQRCQALLKDVPGARLGVAPHSLRAVTPEELAQVVDISSGIAADAPIQIHIAEQVGEVRDCLAWSGARPVQWLLDHFAVDKRWCLVHATHVEQDELSRIAASGATVGLCPITEANLGDGIFPVPEFLAQGGHFGIGTDSNVQISVAGELSLLEYSQRLSRRVRNVVAMDGASTGRALLQRAFTGGGQALGMSGAGLVAGAPADMVSLSVEEPAMIGRKGDALLDSWIFAAPHTAVDCVWVGGSKLAESGRHLKRDTIRRDYRKAMEELCTG